MTYDNSLHVALCLRFIIDSIQPTGVRLEVKRSRSAVIACWIILGGCARAGGSKTASGADATNRRIQDVPLRNSRPNDLLPRDQRSILPLCRLREDLSDRLSIISAVANTKITERARLAPRRRAWISCQDNKTLIAR